MNSSVFPSVRTIALVFLAGLLISGCSKKTSEESIASAQEFIQANDINAAIIELKSAIQADPQSALARFELGKVYLDTKDFASAEKELRRAMELGHPSSQVVPLLSVAYQRTGAHNAMVDVDHANNELSSAERAEVGFYKLQSLVELGEVEQARALIAELQALDTVSVYKGLASTIEMVLNEDFEAALVSASEMRDQSPLNRDALIILARLQMRLQQVDQSIETYVDYLSKFPEDTNTKFVVASMLTELGRTQQAEKYVDDLLELSPKNPMLNQLKGIVLAERADFDEAFTFLKTAIDAGRNDPVLRLVSGYTAYQLGDFEYANTQLSMIASVLPDDHAGLKLLAASQLQLGLSDDAISALSRVDTVTQEDAQLFSRAGFELLKAGNVEDARSIVERTKDLTENADDLLRLGVLQLSMNQIEGIINLEEAVAKAPESSTAQSTLATAYLATNQIDKATALAREWKTIAPNDIRPYLLEADIAIRANDFATANAEYEAALAISPQDSNVMLAKAKMFAQQNKFAEAKSLVDSVVANEPQNLGALVMSYMIDKQTGDASAVVNKATQLLSSNQNDQSLRLIVARMQASEGQFEQALTTLERIKADLKTPKEYWTLKGQALLQSRELDGARNHYSEWSKLFPHDKDATLGLLLIYDLTGQTTAALDVTKRFLSKREDVQVSLLESYFYSLDGNVEKSREILSSAPAAASEMPFVQGIIARNFNAEGKFSEAMQPAAAAYEDKRNLRNLLMLLRSYEGAGHEDKAFDTLKQHASEFPDDSRVSMLLAERKIGRDTDAAIQEYQKLVDANKNNFVALNNLAYLQLQRGNLEQAELLAERAVDLQPKNPATNDTLAQVYVAQKQFGKAIALYNDVITPAMQNEEIYLNYVETLLLNGDTVLAERRANERKYKDAASLETVKRLIATYNISVTN